MSYGSGRSHWLACIAPRTSADDVVNAQYVGGGIFAFAAANCRRHGALGVGLPASAITRRHGTGVSARETRGNVAAWNSMTSRLAW